MPTQNTTKAMITKLRIDEHADIDGRRAGFLSRVQGRVMLAVQGDEYVGEVDAADRESDDRVDHVLDEAADDAGEGGADDDADRQVDDVPPHDERAKFTDPAWLGRQIETCLHPLSPI